MQMRSAAASWITIGAIGMAGTLAGCNDSNSGNNSGTIGFEEGPALAVKAGSFREVVLSLQGGSGVVGQKVRLASSDTTIANVTPASCTLSSSSNASSKCTVKIHGMASGKAVLAAQADGYADAPITATVTDAVVYGSLEVQSDAGTFAATTPLAVSFNGAGTAPYTKTLTAEISGSSGITNGTGAYINFSATSNATFNPPQCQVTLVSPQCVTTVTFAAAQATAVVVAVVGAVTAASPGYSSITVNAAPTTTPTYGTIALSTQSGNNVPNGMKAPLFVNWINASIKDAVSVTLSIQGSGVSFYSYTPGNNTTMNTAQTQTCTLQYTNNAATNVLNCGLGLVGQSATGTVTINAVATATSGTQYTIAPLILNAIAPEAARRTITFTNNSPVKAIYVGITGGAASSYVNASTTAVPAGTTTANMKPGAGSYCGPSNPQAACPIGTTCLQGGSAPNSSISDTPFYCYYDQNAPSPGYKIAPGGGTTTLQISGSSLAPNNIIWSGNFYGRTGCDETTGVCENATCAGTAGGLACGPGTGPTPGTNTLAELTFQAYSDTDFYDVSIINGVNFAIEFGPNNVTASTSNAYSCGIAGSILPQNGGYTSGSTSTAGLPGATWVMAPSAASFPPSAPVTGDAISYFRAVNPPAGYPVTTCTKQLDCAGIPATTCGYPMSSLNSTFDFATRTCGTPVAFLTADGIWGFNQTAANAAPFAFSTSWNPTPTTSVSVGNLQLCNNNTYSAYLGNGTTSTTPPFPQQSTLLACGGVMWGATETPLQNPGATPGRT